MATMAATKISHFGFCKMVVADLDKVADFYREVFGLIEWQRVKMEQSSTTGGPLEEIVFRATAEGGPSLTIVELKDRPAPALGETILGFITDDIEALLDRAVKAGGSIATPVKHQPEHGVRVTFIRDNEGHLVEVVQLAG